MIDFIETSFFPTCLLYTHTHTAPNHFLLLYLPPSIFLHSYFTLLIHSYILYTPVIPAPNYMQPDSPPITASWHFLMDMETVMRASASSTCCILPPCFSPSSPHAPLCAVWGGGGVMCGLCVYLERMDMCVCSVCVMCCVMCVLLSLCRLFILVWSFGF